MGTAPVAASERGLWQRLSGSCVWESEAGLQFRRGMWIIIKSGMGLLRASSEGNIHINNSSSVPGS